MLDHERKLTYALNRTILVMDDDTDMLELYHIQLSRLGCKTIDASDGEQAVALYRQSLQSNHPIDAVIVDQNMPGSISGKDVASRILAINANAKLIISSGDSHGPLMTHYKDYGFQAALEKDFDRNKIKHVLEDLLCEKTA